MRPAIAILKSVGRAMRRDLGSFMALKVNNFFLFVLFLIYSNVIYHLQPHSAYPFLLMVVFLLLFPLSSDPLAKIPSARLGLWPLGPSQRITLRLASVALSPVFWIALLLMARTAYSLALLFLALAVALQMAMAWASSPRWNHAPRIVIPGRLGPLVVAAIRQMLTLLDTYVAALLSLGGCVYRFLYPAPDPAAYAIFALLIALALSTYAQCLFGLDDAPALTRYRLLPLPPWQILMTKDAAFLAILSVLVAPLNIVAGLTAGLIALAIGRYSSIYRRNPQYRWRFTGGRAVVGVAQIVLSFGLGFAAATISVSFLGLAVAGYAASTYLTRGGAPAPFAKFE